MQANDIENTELTVAKAVSDSAPDAPLRIFTLEIGECVSSAMCKGIACAGNGLCLFAVANEDIVGKCA
jgi:hypothetical protein